MLSLRLRHGFPVPVPGAPAATRRAALGELDAAAVGELANKPRTPVSGDPRTCPAVMPFGSALNRVNRRGYLPGSDGPY